MDFFAQQDNARSVFDERFAQRVSFPTSTARSHDLALDPQMPDRDSSSLIEQKVRHRWHAEREHHDLPAIATKSRYMKEEDIEVSHRAPLNLSYKVRSI